MLDISICIMTYLQFSQTNIIYSHRVAWGINMIQEEKLKKVCNDFSLLDEGQQDYILGILQALVFAKSSYNQIDSDSSKNHNHFSAAVNTMQ
jgi:hypothetical protein